MKVKAETPESHEKYIASLHENPPITCCNRTRYAIMAVSFVCLAWLMGNSLILNFTIICMSDKPDNQPINISSSVEIRRYSDSEVSYTNSEKGLLFIAIAIGTLVGTYPVVMLETMLSIRNLFTAFGMLSAISTLFLPVCVSIGFWAVFAMRFLQGFALAVSYPVLGSIVSNWSPLKYTGMYTAWMSCNLQFGPMVTMPAAGGFCVSSFGWQGIYYLQGMLTIISFIVFYFVFRDSPRIHKYVSAKEMREIEDGKTAICEKKVQSVPYKAVFTCPAIWGVWICCIGATFGYQIFLQYGPFYLNKVLNYEITNTGFMSAFPNLVSAFLKILGGPLSDMATCMSSTNRVKMFTILSQGVMALAFICLALVPMDMVFLAQIAYTAAVAFSGLMWVGPVKSGSLVARQHAHFVLAVISFINSAGIIVLPPIVSLIAPDNAPEQWSLLLYLICGSIIACTSLFVFVGSGEPAAWTESELPMHKVYTSEAIKPADVIKTEQ